ADAEMDIERGGGIGAESDIERMAERELPGKAHHDVPRLPDIGEGENEEEHAQQMAADEIGRDQERGQDREQNGHAGARDSVEQVADHDGFLPTMPCGRNSSTSTRMPKANMRFAEGVKRTPPSASVTPIRTPPRSAPGMEPRPPVMTITKASSV